MVKFLLLGCAALFTLTDAAKVPENWIACGPPGPNHNECLKGAIQKAAVDLKNGNKQLTVPSIDPLYIDTMSITRGQGPIKINLELYDNLATGGSGLVVDGVKNDWKKMEVNFTLPEVKITGKYKVDGQILVLPITGAGPCQLEYKNLRARAVVLLSEKMKNGETYYHMDSAKFYFDADSMKMKFENLFNGDKLLGDQMNIFINENWKLLFKETGPSLALSMSRITVDVANRVFSRIPKNVITPK